MFRLLPPLGILKNLDGWPVLLKNDNNQDIQANQFEDLEAGKAAALKLVMPLKLQSPIVATLAEKAMHGFTCCPCHHFAKDGFERL